MSYHRLRGGWNNSCARGRIGPLDNVTSSCSMHYFFFKFLFHVLEEHSSVDMGSILTECLFPHSFEEISSIRSKYYQKVLLCEKRGALFCLAFNVEHMGILPTCMSVHHVCAWCPKKGTGSPRTGVSNGCKLPGPVEES